MTSAEQINSLTTRSVLERLPKQFDLQELPGIIISLRYIKATTAEEFYIYPNHAHGYSL